MNALTQHASFGQQVGRALGLIALLAVVANIVGILALRTVVRTKDEVIDRNAAMLLEIEAAKTAREQRAKHTRSYVIAREEKFARKMLNARDDLLEGIDRMREKAKSDKERQLIETMHQRNAAMQAAWDEMISRRRAGATVEEVRPFFSKHSATTVANLDKAFVALTNHERALLRQAQKESSETADTAIQWLIASGVLTAILAFALAIFLAGSLRKKIGSAVLGMQSSSSELESAAHQQVSSTQELTSTTNEITVTIRELLATSRQISESAQRVVHIAEETGDSATLGNETVLRTQEAIIRIKGQVDQIVSRMVDLGRKSQQIGGILELINELSEQTNILSINASIEAAGAGDSGRRFGVVADEIRRLADRVGGSAREIRTLIDEIRAAANATVMATEDGSKSVEAGARQFSEVLSTFESIVDRVGVTTEAAKEIELSTKQQTTAVEQLNVAIGGVAQAAKETQSSSAQTLATCSELAGVSRALSTLIRRADNDQLERAAS